MEDIWSATREVFFDFASFIIALVSLYFTTNLSSGFCSYGTITCKGICWTTRCFTQLKNITHYLNWLSQHSTYIRFYKKPDIITTWPITWAINSNLKKNHLLDKNFADDVHTSVLKLFYLHRNAIISGL